MGKVTKLPTRKEVPETKRPVHSVPANDLLAAGKRLRDTIPRASQGEWKRHKDRADPIELLQASDAGRVPELIPIRYGRMLQTPFTFYRGSAGVMMKMTITVAKSKKRSTRTAENARAVVTPRPWRRTSIIATSPARIGTRLLIADAIMLADHVAQ